jgi:polyisoprenoid-binding protein YceI
MLHSMFALVLQVTAVAAAPSQPSAQKTTVSPPPVVLAPVPVQARLKLVVAPDGNETRFKVNETLMGAELPNDAIGKTSRVSGSLVVEPNGQIVTAESRFEVELDSLVSDQSRRDNFIKRNTLQTAQYPKAVFVPTSVRGLPARLPVAQDLTFELVGDLTVRDVTKPVTWQVKGRMLANGEITGTATTNFTFAEFNMERPRVARVLSVAERIDLEYDFKLVPATASGSK